MPLMSHKRGSVDDTVRAMAGPVGPLGFLHQNRALLNREDRRNSIGDTTRPTLILCGREDAVCPVGIHEDLADSIGQSQLVVIPDAGHLSTLDQPELVTAALNRWLRATLASDTTDRNEHR